MSKTSAEIDIELVLYECCIADMALRYVQKEIYGLQDLEQELDKLTFTSLLYKYLLEHDAIIDLQVLTQDQLEAQLEKLNNLCGCATCKDSASIVDDTLPTGLSTIF